MWIGLPCAMLMAASSSSGVTARSECGAMPVATLRAIVSHRSCSRRRHEAALSLGRRRAAELRSAIQHRQQRQADAGARPRPRCDAQVPPDRHSASRRARCAGSGTRRPRCSRAAGTPRIAAPRSPRRPRGSGARGSGTSPRASARNCRPRVPRVRPGPPSHAGRRANGDWACLGRRGPAGARRFRGGIRRLMVGRCASTCAVSPSSRSASTHVVMQEPAASGRPSIAPGVAQGYVVNTEPGRCELSRHFPRKREPRAEARGSAKRWVPLARE